MSAHPKALKIKDFTYDLPEARIAKFPLGERSAAKLLVYRAGKIQDHAFTELPALLPPQSLLVFNNTRVVQARLYIQRATGSTVEVFCLEPVAPSAEMQQAMQQTHCCTWNCLVGNAKKWKEPELSLAIPLANQQTGQLTVRKGERQADSYLIHFSWTPASLTFAEILEQAGNLPLPPYLNRPATAADRQTYQTVYARQEGAVAAPTAGLHFSRELMKRLELKGVEFAEVTLHVGLGTFRAVEVEDLTKHKMDSEQFIIEQKAADIVNKAIEDKRRICAVGTTSMRAIESAVSANHTLKQANDWTSKFIFPPYDFSIANSMITNFHTPESTLLMMVSAFGGYEHVMHAYEVAVKEKYRFYSYGDAMLII